MTTTQARPIRTEERVTAIRIPELPTAARVLLGQGEQGIGTTESGRRNQHKTPTKDTETRD